MEGKLIKIDGTYILSVNEYKDEVFAIADINKAHELDKHKLSLKNCQSIENGYDLDELAYTESEDFVDNFDYNDGRGNICRFNNSHEAQECYIKGFKKAVELLGDKKFSEEDIRKVIDKTLYSWNSTAKTELDEKNDMIQSLQQTEWDVRVVMCCGLPDGCTEPEVICPSNCEIVPLLDADGCLILYRI